MFTTYNGVVMANASTILEVMRALKSVDGLAYVHAEHDHIVRDAQHSAAERGAIHAGGHAGTRPLLAETAAVSEVLSIAEYLDAPVYFVHQTTPEAVDLVRAARTAVSAPTPRRARTTSISTRASTPANTPSGSSAHPRSGRRRPLPHSADGR